MLVFFVAIKHINHIGMTVRRYNKYCLISILDMLNQKLVMLLSYYQVDYFEFNKRACFPQQYLDPRKFFSQERQQGEREGRGSCIYSSLYNLLYGKRKYKVDVGLWRYLDLVKSICFKSK
ncbi:hypothetical protein PHYBLDRAFT_173540 [Phycomyces blakesleeanus NRRL 1555(-)]|uniref:Uncharacterized protein n=1 Tax=Phycomyces blakesleeanus (strain ATCC 8743b / DSM 1359 / FGSC 10004 / NBRC 33097 / NRRL 1555) TaxID=763407 RepID=A0A162NCF6_PHYB8|nr:hypothetical protein PHYBLDRAFT_173540 [Phycomyces blakesleeanus NRRL 1555(-)]OAD68044.1 hypothetical protein PHYBLDRAFT_173540 [Phycomyces blakesleeanus NRRL 1555(-)]|eukprot:XP_018286084.1 hypothetical protein PHYBLDRAFT_173540 [Phycomyces blakesleeanus NRRL 1555(-)]